MAKKKKISPRRIEKARKWLLKARAPELERYMNAVTPSLQKAAEAFHLDAHNQSHREILVRILSHLTFADGKRGRPEFSLKWDARREFELGAHFYQLRQENPKIKYSAAAKAIKVRWKKEYDDCSETTLRQRMRQAYIWFVDVQEDAENNAELVRAIQDGTL